MTERPILFNDAMVSAILAGKTQTRRPVKPQPPCDCIYTVNGGKDRALCLAVPGSDVPTNPWFVPPRASSADVFIRCPFGQPGGRLWVRECWGTAIGQGGESIEYLYRERDGVAGGPYKPSIHMPRAACRITLAVTDVRVERVQDISEDEARAEGTIPLQTIGKDQSMPFPGFKDKELYWDRPHRSQFSLSWSTIYASRGLGWDENPWVWVVEFKIKQTGEQNAEDQEGQHGQRHGEARGSDRAGQAHTPPAQLP